MKNQKVLLLPIGVISIILAIIMFFFAKIDSPLFLFVVPFDLIGTGLRYLSLSSGIGNIIAILLYTLLSMLPIVYLVIRKSKKGLKRIDFLLFFLSTYLFYMLYQFINPGLMLNQAPELLADESMIPMIKLSYSLTFFSLIVGYFLCSMVGHLKSERTMDKFQYLCIRLKYILLIVTVIYIFIFGYFMVFQMLQDISRYMEKNTVTTFLNFFFLVVSYLLEGIPSLFAILILIAGIDLLQSMIMSHLEEEEVRQAEYLGIISKYTVYITVICNVSLNLLQLFFSSNLNDTNYQLNLSFTPLILAFSSLILSAYFKESKEIQEDNEMII